MSRQSSPLVTSHPAPLSPSSPLAPQSRLSAPAPPWARRKRTGSEGCRTSHRRRSPPSCALLRRFGSEGLQRSWIEGGNIAFIEAHGIHSVENDVTYRERKNMKSSCRSNSKKKITVALSSKQEGELLLQKQQQQINDTKQQQKQEKQVQYLQKLKKNIFSGTKLIAAPVNRKLNFLG